MRIPTKAMVSGTLAIAAIVVAATISLAGGGGSNPVPASPGNGAAPSDPTGSNGGLAMCIAPTGPTGPETPVCNDVITVPGDDVPDPGPQVVEPRPGMARVYPRIFDTATVGDDGRTVSIDFVSGVEPCYVLDRVDVAYGADTVTITLFEGNDPDHPDVACIEIGVFKRVVITLDEPLAGRTIVDGAAG